MEPAPFPSPRAPIAGDAAPGFTLPGTAQHAGRHAAVPRRHYDLDAYRGRPVLLVFFGAAFTPT